MFLVRGFRVKHRAPVFIGTVPAGGTTGLTREPPPTRSSSANEEFPMELEPLTGLGIGCARVISAATARGGLKASVVPTEPPLNAGGRQSVGLYGA